MEVFQEFISLLIFDYLKVLINELKKNTVFFRINAMYDGF